jgi:hypothetical protein
MVTVEDFSRLVSGIYAAAVTSPGGARQVPTHTQAMKADAIGRSDCTGLSTRYDGP